MPPGRTWLRGGLALAAAGLLAVGLSLTVLAQAPAWWTNQHVLVTGATPNDYAALNQGQLKWLATQAATEFAADGLTSTNIMAMVLSFSSTNNYLPVNLGQLKNVVQPFYDRLWTNGLTNCYPTGAGMPYPWSNATHPPNDYALANVGQAKWLFSFNPDSDVDDFSSGSSYYWGVNPLSSSGSGATGSSGGGPGSSSGNGQSGSSGGSNVYGQAVTIYGEVQNISLTKYGFDTYQPTTPPQRYLTQIETWTDGLGGYTGADIGPGAVTSSYDPRTGALTRTALGIGIAPVTGPANSPTDAGGLYPLFFVSGGTYFDDHGDPLGGVVLTPNGYQDVTTDLSSQVYDCGEGTEV